MGFLFRDIPLVKLPSEIVTSNRHHDGWAFLVVGMIFLGGCTSIAFMPSVLGATSLVVLIGMLLMGLAFVSLATIHFFRTSKILFSDKGLTLYQRFAGAHREQYIPYPSYRGLRYRRLGLASNRGDFFTHQIWLEHRCKDYSVLLFSQRDGHHVDERLTRFQSLLGVAILESDLSGSDSSDVTTVVAEEGGNDIIPEGLSVEKKGEDLVLKVKPDALNAHPVVMYVSFPLLLFFCGYLVPELSQLLWGVGLGLGLIFALGMIAAKTSTIEVAMGRRWVLVRRYLWGKGHETTIAPENIEQIAVKKDSGEPATLFIESENMPPVIVASHKDPQVLIWLKKIMDRAWQSRHASRPHD